MAEGIYTLLAQAQAEMPIPEAVKTGQQGNRKYKYVTLAQVLDIIRPPLNKRGLFLTQKTVMNERGMFIQTIVGHGDDVVILDEEPYEYQTSPQEYGKRETYAKRYSLFKAFGIVGDEDTDGNVTGRSSQYQTQMPQAPQAPQMPDADRQELRSITNSLIAIGRDGSAEGKAVYAQYQSGGMEAARNYLSMAMQDYESEQDSDQPMYAGGSGPYDMADEDIDF